MSELSFQPWLSLNVLFSPQTFTEFLLFPGILPGIWEDVEKNKNGCGPEIFYSQASPSVDCRMAPGHSGINTEIEDKHLETFMAVGLCHDSQVRAQWTCFVE